MDELISFLKNNPAVVSVCAFFLTIYQARTTYKHNRLSVQPRLTTFMSFERDPGDNKITQVKVTLTNSGLGPAIIRKFEILLGDKPYLVTEPDECLRLIYENVNMPILKGRTSVLRKEHSLSKDSNVDLIYLEVLEMTSQHKRDLQIFNVRVTYESAYKQTFKYDSRMHK
jgi:hypothetical protein